MHENLLVLSDTNLYAGEGFANGIKHMLVVRGSSNNRRALGCPIALHDTERHVLPAFGQRRRQICPSTDKKAEVTAKTLVDSAKEDASPCERQASSDTQKHLKLLFSLLATHFTLNTVQEELQRLRYQHHAGDVLRSE